MVNLLSVCYMSCVDETTEKKQGVWIMLLKFNLNVFDFCSIYRYLSYLCLTFAWMQTKQLGLGWVSCCFYLRSSKQARVKQAPEQNRTDSRDFSPCLVKSYPVALSMISVISRRSLKQRWVPAAFLCSRWEGVWCPTGNVLSSHDFQTHTVPKQKRSTHLDTQFVW